MPDVRERSPAGPAPSFLLGNWLDDVPNLTCKDGTRQHAADGCPLIGK
jgi:hypothetical protein